MSTAYVLIFVVLSSGFYGGTHTVAMHQFGNEQACKAAGVAAAKLVETNRNAVVWACVKHA